jgi:hypothetical protein
MIQEVDLDAIGINLLCCSAFVGTPLHRFLHRQPLSCRKMPWTRPGNFQPGWRWRGVRCSGTV